MSRLGHVPGSRWRFTLLCIADDIAPIRDPKCVEHSSVAMKSKPKTIDEYLAGTTEDKRASLERLRKTIRAAAPKAEECISYGLAAFKLNGSPLVAFGATAHHCAFYLMSGSPIQAHQHELKGRDCSKGTIRFQADSPLPATLVRRLVKARIIETQLRNRKKTRPRAAHRSRDAVRHSPECQDGSRSCKTPARQR